MTLVLALLAIVDDSAVRALLVKIQAGLPKLEARLEQFGYRESDSEFEDGKQKKNDVYEVTFYKGRRVRRLVSRMGAPLAGKDLEKENRRIEREIEDLSKGKIPPLTNRRIRIEDLLSAAEFTNGRETVLNGRKVIETEFHPKPNHKPANTNQRFIQNVDGKLWLDPEALQMAQADFTLRGDFKIAGGLFFNMKQGTHYTERQNWAFGEVWLPEQQQFAMKARAMIGVKLDIRVVRNFDNYQRFDVSTQQTIAAPVK